MTYKEIQEEAMRQSTQDIWMRRGFVEGVLWRLKQEHPKDWEELFVQMGVPKFMYE